MKTIEQFKSTSMFSYNTDFFINKLENKEYFSYSRFNDGELICAINSLSKNSPSGRNCDNHQYFPEMGKELIASLNRSDCKSYFIQYLAGWIADPNFAKHSLDLLNGNMLNGKYQFSDFLQIALRTDPINFRKFINILNSNKVIIVGPEYLSSISFVKYQHFIEVPRLNCYTEKKSIINQLKKILTTDYIVLFSASMATNVIIDHLHEKYGNSNFMIDAGSIWDIFYIDSNSGIRQRTPNLQRLDRLREYYPNYFQKNTNL